MSRHQLTTSFSQAHPELVSQWSQQNAHTPDKTHVNSTKETLWECGKCQHSWTATPNRRHLRPLCPGCLKAERTIPSSAQKWTDHPLDGLPRSSKKRIDWKCPHCHNVFTRAVRAFINNMRCPLCHFNGVEGDLTRIVAYSPLALEWSKKNPEDPSTVYVGSSNKAWWRCSDCSHEWESVIYVRNNGSGCPRCAALKNRGHIPPDRNLLTVSKPELEKEWRDSTDFSSYSYGSKYKALWRCADCSHEYRSRISDRSIGKGCPRCAYKMSVPEQQLREFIESLDCGEVLSNTRGVISPYEVDIYLPEKQIAIEFNGLYWHSEDRGKGRRYHYDKWRECCDKGIQLITVWEDEWRDKQTIVEAMLRSKLGCDDRPIIYGRKTMVVDVGIDDAREFLDAYHIQGFTQGSLYSGLVHDDELVAVAVWRRSSGRLYLDRYATGARVIGGMGKLLKAAVEWGRSNMCSTIITFADHAVSNGNLYQRLGFQAETELPPDYRYLVKMNRVHKFNYRLARFRRDPELEYVEGLSERELATLNGIPRIWDCGKTRYVYSIPHNDPD